MTPQIFYDPRGRRWRRFKTTAHLVATALIIVFSVLGVTVVSDPALNRHSLPSLKISTKYHRLIPSSLGPHAPIDRGGRSAVLGTGGLDATPTARHRFLGELKPIGIGEGQRIGFYADGDPASFASLRHNLSHLDKVMPDWLHATKADGTIASYAEDVEKVITYVGRHRGTVAIVPVVTNFNAKTERWENVALSRMLADPVARARGIGQLLKFVREWDAKGICVDFEGISLNDPNLASFLSELYAQFHPLGLEVAQKVPLDDPTANYGALGEVSDYLILAAYDERVPEDGVGPVASLPWYVGALQRRFADLPPDKYVIAIGNYGYDWKDDGSPAAELTIQEVLKIARDSDSNIAVDEESFNPSLRYAGDDRFAHHVWFLDAVTGFNQMVEGHRYGPRGFALWRLGTEDPALWRVFGRGAWLDRKGATALQVLPPGPSFDQTGQGEILKVTAGPRDGVRAISYSEPLGLIVNEHIRVHPSAHVTARWGAGHPNQIALTFDDGPDPQYTPAVLDILAHYRVPATFFVVGARAMLNAELLHRIIREGHEIGNHTFTHPNITKISERQFGVELNATERLLETTLGRRSLLFRPPYSVDLSADTPEQVTPLLFASRLGYYVVDANVDPRDWRKPGVDQIVKAVVEAAVKHEGNVVLLHDSGGDRSQTIAALPRIIEGLQARGFHPVRVSDLVGLTRDAVMPAVAHDTASSLAVTHVGFEVIGWSWRIIQGLFILGLLLGIPRPFILGTLAIIHRRKHRRYPPSVGELPLVGVVVPAHNEAKVICQTVGAVLNSNYPRFEVIVVDDGSTDGTYDLVVDTFRETPQVRPFTQPNRGKGQALNFGISQTQAPIIVTIDADTIVRPETIDNLVPPFANPRVGAVAGNAKVGNRRRLLARWQALEYITTQNMERRAFALLNCITVVPGAVGAWRREAVLRAGGFTTRTIAEDADLTCAILRLGYIVDYAETAIGLTEAPETLRSFLKQRFRWMYGTLQAIWGHLDVAFRRRYKALGMVGIPYVFIFQILFSLISPVLDLVMLLMVAALLWQRAQHPLSYSSDGLMRVVGFFVLFQAAELLSTLLAFTLETEDRRLIPWVFIQRFVYRLLLYYVGMRTLVTAVKGKIVGWSKFERKATVLARAEK
ncbi:MAG TPA: glycosyltransferase [bacterium]|nr:glycosyltransferase [bacterium]